MSTRTWTFIKPEYLTREEKTKLLERALDSLGGTHYYKNYQKRGWSRALEDWLRFNNDNHDYLTRVLGIPDSHLTTEYLTENLRKKIDACHEKEEYYKRCLAGNMSSREMLCEVRKLDGGKSSDIHCIDRQNDVYVHIPHEWWRNYRPSDDEFCTVDSLIEEVRKSTSLTYYEDKIKMSTELKSLTPFLERELREYYGKIGDNNFYVHFG